jgi:hypothetical protein
MTERFLIPELQNQIVDEIYASFGGQLELYTVDFGESAQIGHERGVAIIL